MLDAEEEAERPKKRLPSLKELEEKRLFEETQGLCNPASLEIFTTWFLFNGPQAGITPLEALQMPAFLRKDFSLILSRLGEERKRRKPTKAK